VVDLFLPMAFKQIELLRHFAHHWKN